ncbi:uncharacterized protein LOC127861256 [Dreissena polymorpha]|uniref:Uncharacterized protein n=1 Tax=Dreissena polymorpha TaxID=45954 RepID=A0A9D4BDW3_DREPO|nr:uncharacterized protein LOC127861256 [Dreissena polymorpha]KAH3699285.1 hypothetical protein DPMN_074240 [Dreissena polymorpha]
MWKLVLFSSFLVVAVEADKNVTVGGITTKVLGQSGKIKVYKATGNESEGVTITMDEIKELDSANNATPSHSFNTFATMNFNFSQQTETTYKGTDVNVTQFSFTANIRVGQGQTIDGTAKLTSYVYIFSSNGNITVDGKNMTVRTGDMKFNVKIESWPFCGVGNVSCTQGQTSYKGAYLDFYVEIKGKGSVLNSSAGGNNTYELGGATVMVPTEVIYTNSSDYNETKQMPAGFPKVEMKGTKQTFVFRFEPFTKSALYDPIVKLTDENSTTTPTSAPSEDKDISDSGVSVKVLGKSGKIAFTNSDGKKTMTVEFDNLKEKTFDGSDIKDNNHGYNNFASQTFTFGAPIDSEYPETNISTKKLNFSAEINNGAKVMVDMYIFKQGGNISQDGEDTVVKRGDLKFSVTVSGWTFCNGTCQPNEVGEYLDFDIVIKGARGATKSTSDGKKPDQYDVGSGVVLLSKKLKKDNENYENMTATYPMLMTQGSKQIFRLRFPKFTKKVFYDPSLSFFADSGTGGSAGMSAGSLLLMVASLLAMSINRY